MFPRVVKANLFLARCIFVKCFIPAPSSDDLSCAGEEATWHFIRESAYYIMYEGTAGLRTSSARIPGFVRLWMDVDFVGLWDVQAHVHSSCPVGTAFLMVLDILCASIPALNRGHSLHAGQFQAALRILEQRASFAGVLHSGWPIFGVLALAQQVLLGLGGVSPLDYQDPLPSASVCEAGRPVAAALLEWLEASAPFLGSVASLEHYRLACGRLAALITAEPSLCTLDYPAVSALYLADVLTHPKLHNAIADRSEDAALELALNHSGWQRLFFTHWPVFAVLHRIQEAFVREAWCSEADPQAYALQSRQDLHSVWVCARRGWDVVDERWRNHGVFPDCVPITNIMKSTPTPGECIFLDVGANIGGCSLPAAKLGFHVLAVEPSPGLARRLQAAVQRNSFAHLVTVIEVAADRTRRQGFLACPPGESAICQVHHNGTDVYERINVLTEPQTVVQSVALDNVIGSIRHRGEVCAVKVDVEGSEADALLGLAKTLEVARPTLFLDLHPWELNQRGSSSEHVIDFLVVRGYTRFEPLSGVHSCTAKNGRIYGNGTYKNKRWRNAEAVSPPVFGVRDPCFCDQLCTRRLLEGCRCWDMEVASGRCALYRLCVSILETEVAAAGSASAPAEPAWWAGEFRGSWYIRAMPSSNGQPSTPSIELPL